MPAVIPRDDRAWPRGAVTFSALVAAVAVAAGVALTVAAADRGPLPAAAAGGVFVAVLAAEVAVYLRAIRPWLRGGPMPRSLVRGQLLGLAVAFLTFVVDLRVGGAALSGLFAGMMAGNVAAVRVARRNRGRVDAAEAAGPVPRPVPGGPPAEAERAAGPVRQREAGDPPAEPLGRVLRESVATDTRLALAWLVAAGVVAAGSAVLGAPVWVTVPVLLLAGVGLFWVLRRLWAGWLALQDFTRGATPPVRAYVTLVREPNPRLIRPMLGIWSEPPEVRGGRLPRPERVYRADADHVRLECTRDSLVVHEAWVDTGPRPGSKPRWVSADGGLALPHRRALGRWYLSSLIGGGRPGPPVPLTQPPPRPEAVEVMESGPGWDGLLRAVAVRTAGLAAATLILAWITSFADGQG